MGKSIDLVYRTIRPAQFYPKSPGATRLLVPPDEESRIFDFAQLFKELDIEPKDGDTVRITVETFSTDLARVGA